MNHGTSPSADSGLIVCVFACYRFKASLFILCLGLSVPGEKRSALLAEVARLRDDRSLESDEATGDKDFVSQQPCRGTVSISHVQLPLKVEFVCSSRNRTGTASLASV